MILFLDSINAHESTGARVAGEQKDAKLGHYN